MISPYTTVTYRNQFLDALVKWSILKNISLPLTNADNEYDFRSSFWPMELIFYKSDFVKQRLEYAFSKAANCSKDFQRGLVEVVYTNWPDTFRPEVTQLMDRTEDPKIFAMCAEYLWQNGHYPDQQAIIHSLLYQKFDSIPFNPILKMLNERISRRPVKPLPALPDILSEQFAPGLTVIYSFQRKNRDFPGMAVVRRPDGKFIRDSTGQIFAVPQLARSITNLPFYLTNGNTPQGVYRMSGYEVSRSRFIGPTQNIQLSMPYEIPADSFLVSPAPNDTCWNMELYQNLLPLSWQRYEPIYESFYAGKAGRTAIIAHGTTIDPAYYKGKSYYPQTPSQGCLCTYEKWSLINGQREKSDQQKLVDAVKKAGNGTGYAVVIDLNNEKRPVRLADILNAILETEKRE